MNAVRALCMQTGHFKCSQVVLDADWSLWMQSDHCECSEVIVNCQSVTKILILEPLSCIGAGWFGGQRRD